MRFFPSISCDHWRWMFWYEIPRIQPPIQSQRQYICSLALLCLTWPWPQLGKCWCCVGQRLRSRTSGLHVLLETAIINRDWFKCNCFKLITQFSSTSISTISTCGSSSVASVLTPGAMTRTRVFFCSFTCLVFLLSFWNRKHLPTGLLSDNSGTQIHMGALVLSGV